MDLLVGAVLGSGVGAMVGRLYGGVWPLGRAWWREVVGDAHEPPRHPEAPRARRAEERSAPVP